LRPWRQSAASACGAAASPGSAPAAGLTALGFDAKSSSQVERDDGADLQELLTVGEVAALLKVSKSWVYEHTRSRGMPRSERLPHIKVGKYVRFEARAVRAFLDAKCRTT
jgi:excisionase family DNA binding protein